MTPADRNKWTLIVVGVVIAVLAGSWVYWFVENYDRRERTVRSETSPEARRNPYLAAARYLSRFGHEVDSIRGRDQLKKPPQGAGALVVHDAGPSLPLYEEDRLLEWVNAGGHLILVPRHTWNEDTQSARNHIYDRFGIRLRSRELEVSGSGNDTESRAALQDMVTIRRTDPDTGTQHIYQVAFNPGLYLEDAASTAQIDLSGEHGVHMLAWNQGDGRMTVFSDNRFMHNENIGDYDHAWLISDFLNDHHRIWFLTEAVMPPLTRMLWRHAPEAMWSSILLALMWLWRAARTHGPRRRASSRTRRNIIEHLEAVAAFAWRRDKQHELINHSRSVVERLWRSRHPRLNRLDETSRCAWIAAKTGLREEQVQTALYATPSDEQSLIRNTVLQQRLIRFLSNPTYH